MTGRRTYTKEYKMDAVRLAKERGFEQTGRDLGINTNLIHKWRDKLEKHGERVFPGQGNPRDEELVQLFREFGFRLIPETT